MGGSFSSLALIEAAVNRSTINLPELREGLTRDLTELVCSLDTFHPDAPLFQRWLRLKTPRGLRLAPPLVDPEFHGTLRATLKRLTAAPAGGEAAQTGIVEAREEGSVRRVATAPDLADMVEDPLTVGFLPASTKTAIEAVLAIFIGGLNLHDRGYTFRYGIGIERHEFLATGGYMQLVLCLNRQIGVTDGQPVEGLQLFTRADMGKLEDRVPDWERQEKGALYFRRAGEMRTVAGETLDFSWMYRDEWHKGDPNPEKTPPKDLVQRGKRGGIIDFKAHRTRILSMWNGAYQNSWGLLRGSLRELSS